MSTLLQPTLLQPSRSDRCPPAPPDGDDAFDVPAVAGTWSDELMAVPAHLGPDDADFVRSAGHAARLLDPAVHDRLVDFADDSGPAGALLIRGVPVGELPPTPARPTDPVTKEHLSERLLLTVARRLGQPIAYAPEHSGSLVQNLVPTPDDVGHQTSTSSGVELAFHTETAFHPHRPRYLLLLCLRGDPGAATTLCSAREVLPHLGAGTRDLLRRPRFRTRVDRSFHPADPDRPGPARPILRGTDDRPSLCWDADLMDATTPEAAEALAELATVVAEHHRSVVLEAGDLLVVDNTRCVHGRSPFPARFDGTDRWLQRAFVVADLLPSDAERSGRVVTTRFDR